MLCSKIPFQESRRLLLAGMGALGLTRAMKAIAAPPQARAPVDQFMSPPADTRPLTRWWWFGGAVEREEIVREIQTMKRGGFGGFEIQPVYPLALDNPEKGIRNKPFLSPLFLEMVSVAARTAREEGLCADITLGSGWPYGGPHIPVDLASSHIVMKSFPASAFTAGLNLPPLSPGERDVAAFVGSSPNNAVQVRLDGTRAVFAADTRERTVYLVRQTPTRQQVKRATIGAEGLVLDHLNGQAVRRHLESVGEPLLKAFGGDGPHAIFSDSLEVYGANWTGDLLDEFSRRRGYDLAPHLLSLFHDTDISSDVRYDWSLTLSELVEERYLTEVSTWARTHKTLFRAQTYGIPALSLSSSRLVDLAEGEGADWRTASSTRWVSSANHIYGRRITSAESFTWLHKGAFRATPLDVKGEADRLLLQGVNQFVAHGWPYSPPQNAEPGWSFYAAAVFSEHNPWWPVMKDLNLYLQRLSWLLRQGENVADVAIYVPTEDLMASARPDKNISVNDELRRTLPAALLEAVIDSGFNFDFIDGKAILERGLHYQVLILPNVQRISPEVYERVATFAEAGGMVIAIGTAPWQAAGLADAQVAHQRVAALCAKLTSEEHPRLRETDEAQLCQTLLRLCSPDVGRLPKGVGFVHRRLQSGDFYFVANTTNVAVRAEPIFRDAAPTAQIWDAVSGQMRRYAPGQPLLLAPFGSCVVVFGEPAKGWAAPGPTAHEIDRSEVLADGWTLTLGLEGQVQQIRDFRSWTEDATQRNYSGPGIYRRLLNMTAGDLASAQIELDFGEGQPALPESLNGPGYVATYEAPVRDAAEVFVNGVRAGTVWCAPFRLNLRPFLRAGENHLEVRVYNTAINQLAGRPATDYGQLRTAYGDRFQAQNMTGLAPLPSGLLNNPRLLFRQA